MARVRNSTSHATSRSLPPVLVSNRYPLDSPCFLRRNSMDNTLSTDICTPTRDRGAVTGVRFSEFAVRSTH